MASRHGCALLLAVAAIAMAEEPSDTLPAGAVARLGTNRLRHDGAVLAVAMSPDGKAVASVGVDRTLRFWHADNGRERLRIRIEDMAPEAWFQRCQLRYSPDGKAVAASTETGDIRVWDAASGKTVLSLPWTDPSWAIEFGRGSEVLFWQNDKLGLQAWDVATGRLITKVDCGRSFLLTVSPDGKTLATTEGEPGNLHLFETASGRETLVIEGHQKRVFAAAFSPDGNRLAAADYDKSIRIWDVATGNQVLHIPSGEWVTHAIAWIDDGRSLVAVGDAVTVWDANTGEALHTIDAGKADRVSVAVHGGRIAAAPGDCAIRLYDLSTGERLLADEEATWSVCDVAFSPDGHRLASCDMLDRLWDLGSGSMVHASAREKASSSSVAFSPDGLRVAFGGSYGPTVIRDVESWDARCELVRLLPGPDGIPRSTYAVAFSPDGALLTAGEPGGVRIWMPEQRKEARFIELHGTALSVEFSRDGKTLAAVTNLGSAGLWDVETGKPVIELRGPDFQPGVRALALSPDGRLVATAEEDGSVRLWEIVTGRERMTLSAHEKAANALSFSASGALLASLGTDGLVVLWDPWDGSEVRRLDARPSLVTCMAISPDGRRVATGVADTSILMWDLPASDRRAVPPRRELGRDDIGDRSLGDPDARTAHDAMRLIEAGGRPAVEYLRQVVRPVAPLDERTEAYLVAVTVSRSDGEWQAALRMLVGYDASGAAALRKAREASGSEEVRAAIDEALRGMDRVVVSNDDTLRGIRAVEVLERMRTAEARALLEELSSGAEGARLTRDAQAALDRLGK